jgi:hypothetical protein
MYRQGEVILRPVARIQGKKLPHLILAEGEVTGHKHEITLGQSQLFEQDGMLYLQVDSEKATLTHPDHGALELPQGSYELDFQREYPGPGPEEYRRVVD